jgi:hypothetical protein
MALFLLESRDFLGFRMIFKVWLNRIFSNFNTMDSNVWKFEKIWFSGTFIIIQKPTDGHEDPYIPRLSSSGGITKQYTIIVLSI